MMRFLLNLGLTSVVLVTLVATGYGQKMPTTEAAAIQHLKAKGCSIQQNAAGHATRLMSQGKPPMSASDYQLIGLLTHLEQMGLNAAPLKEDEWGFLKSLPALNRLAIWHCKTIASLEPFSGLKVESLTIGGCMGLRDLNKNNPAKLRNVVLTLHSLPNLKKANLYHSPLLPDDSHLEHMAKEFPQLEELKVDFAAPRGSATSITPRGLSSLQKLPIKVLSIENAGDFQAEHLAAIAGIKTLQTLLVEARRKPAPQAVAPILKKLRPDVAVVVAGPGAKGPPVAPRRKK